MPELDCPSILVVEDEPTMASLLCASLIKEGFAVTSANSVAVAKRAINSICPDAMILDLGLPDGDGLDIVADMRANQRALPVLVLTARDSIANRVIGLDSGADDFMGKPFATSELLARLRALLRRRGGVNGSILEVGNVTVDCERREVRIDGRVVGFVGRELELLQALMRSAEQVIPKVDLQEEIFGSAERSAANRLDVITHRLRRNLALFGANVVIHTFRGVGYMLS